MHVSFVQKIQTELIKMLYQQIRFALWAESCAAIALVVVLWSAGRHELLLGWLAFNLLVCGFARHVLVSVFQRHGQKTYRLFGINIWLLLFGLGAFFSGISWGATGSILMVPNDIMRQTFAIFLLVGVTSVANLFYSPSRAVYAVFLLPAFLPFTVWLIFQGSIFIILSFLAVVYILLALATSYYYNKLLTASLYFRFENSDLIDHLSRAKNSLVKRTKELEKSLSVVKATLESTNDAILVVDSENRIEDFNQKFVEMWQVSPAMLKNSDVSALFSFMADRLENPIRFQEKLRELATNPDEESFDELLFKDGRVFERYSIPQREGNKGIGRVWSFRDVTKHKTLEDKLFRQANFDVLTGLPNRSLLLDRVAQAISFAKTINRQLAILFLDLDRFKLINDTLGHSLGDRLLLEASNRILECIRENDTLSREGGDEFIVILNPLRSEGETIEIVSNILNAIREPFLIGGHKINITISIGISFFPKDGQEPEILIKDADIAMYHAKELGRNNFQFFTEDMNQKVLSRLVMENQLRDALKQNEFSLVYQPIVNIRTGYIVALEALLRWRHPKGLSVPPSEFIGVAEESGLIMHIGDWVLRTACDHAKYLQQNGFPHLQIAVNLSGRQFRQANFLEEIKKILAETELNPHYLALELTESTIMDDLEKTSSILNQMKAMGIAIVIDDFGTGYSSLNYLKQLPVDKVKIDRSFIQDIPMHADDAAITAAIIALAAKLNLIVVAEGVETASQLNFLMEHHCDEMQGFYFSRPLKPEDCLPFLKGNTHTPFPA